MHNTILILIFSFIFLSFSVFADCVNGHSGDYTCPYCGECLDCQPAHDNYCEMCGEQEYLCISHYKRCTLCGHVGFSCQRTTDHICPFVHEVDEGHKLNLCPKGNGCKVCLTCTPAHVGPCDECGEQVYGCEKHDCATHKDKFGHDENLCPKGNGCKVCLTCTPAHVGPCDECGEQVYGCEKHDCATHKDKFGHDENLCPKGNGCKVCLTCTPAHVSTCKDCNQSIYACETHTCATHKDKFGHDENPCPKKCGVCLTCTNDHETQCNTCGKSYYKCETHDCTKSHKEDYGHDIVSCPKGCGVCLACVAHVQVCQTCGKSIYLCSPGHTCSVDAHKNKFGHAFNPCSTCTSVCMSCYPNHNHTPGNTDTNPPAPDWVPIYDDNNNFIGWDTDDDGVPDVSPEDSPVKVVKPGDTPDTPDTPDDPEDKELPLPDDVDFDWPESKALKLIAEKMAVPSFITSFGDKAVVSNIGKWTIPLDLSGSPFNASDFSFEIDFAELDKYPTIAGFLRTLSIVVYALIFIFGIYKALRQW